MHPSDAWMCSVDSRRRKYPPDHEMKMFWPQLSDFHKNGGYLKIIETLWTLYLTGKKLFSLPIKLADFVYFVHIC